MSPTERNLYPSDPPLTKGGNLNPDPRERIRISVRGAVQGVGFRPSVHRLAAALRISGWVKNSPGGALIEAEGRADAIADFIAKLHRALPPPIFVDSLDYVAVPPQAEDGFAIRESDAAGAKTARVLPDIAVCDDCLRETFDPRDRRHLYPFTNCSRCGPRFSIIESLPYDRPRTTMRGFAMCGDCRREYEDPSDRRFHAQPVACPACGPRVELWDRGGRALAQEDEALRRLAAMLREGAVAAVKGLGGFHLMALASDEAAVRRLRGRKRRVEKPFAVMFPSLPSVRAVCEVSAAEEGLLVSPERPIVLLRRGGVAGIAASVAPENPLLGAFLPYTPLHWILLRYAGAPLVATSGNLSEEPICADESEALDRLGVLADVFLVHDRPIARPLDDSVAQVVDGRRVMLRAARGFAPLSIDAGRELPPLLAAGGQMKGAAALTAGRAYVIGPHVGDLDAVPAMEAFERSAAGLAGLFDAPSGETACDLHPDYASTRWAKRKAGRVTGVQHHHAHVAAVIAEHGIEGRVLGVAWDGAGYGPDGTVWGGEFLRADLVGFERTGSLRLFRLPGGDAAAREPRRAALGLLWEIFGRDLFRRRDLAPVRAFAEAEGLVLEKMLAGGVNAPYTSSAGRLFDGVASLLGLRQVCSFEGQAAMAVEFAADPAERDSYPFPACADADAGLRFDWEPLVRAMLDDLAIGVASGRIAGKFHNSLVDAIAAAARDAGECRVVLSGGCFQNRLLLSRAAARLRADGFLVFHAESVPANDGGLALGQAAVAAARRTETC